MEIIWTSKLLIIRARKVILILYPLSLILYISWIFKPQAAHCMELASLVLAPFGKDIISDEEVEKMSKDQYLEAKENGKVKFINWDLYEGSVKIS